VTVGQVLEQIADRLETERPGGLRGAPLEPERRRQPARPRRGAQWRGERLGA
jgi:hypothetical protein